MGSYVRSLESSRLTAKISSADGHVGDSDVKCLFVMDALDESRRGVNAPNVEIESRKTIVDEVEE